MYIANRAKPRGARLIQLLPQMMTLKNQPLPVWSALPTSSLFEQLLHLHQLSQNREQNYAKLLRSIQLARL